MVSSQATQIVARCTSRSRFNPGSQGQAPAGRYAALTARIEPAEPIIGDGEGAALPPSPPAGLRLRSLTIFGRFAHSEFERGKCI